MSKSNDKRQRQLRTTSTIHTVTDTRKMSGDGDIFSLYNSNRFKLIQNIRRQKKNVYGQFYRGGQSVL